MKKYSSDDAMYMNPYDFGDESSSYPFDDYMTAYDPSFNQMNVKKGIQMPQYDEERDEADWQYMKSLYPDFCKRIQPLVDEECNGLDYEGSIMYDEYPDKETIYKIVAKIYAIVEKDYVTTKETETVDAEVADVDTQQYTYNVAYPWLWDNVQVQFLNELFGRRRRRYPRRYRYSYPHRPYYGYRPYRRHIYLPYNPYVPYGYRYY